MSHAYRNRSCNVMLQKDDVGKPKPTAYDLPDESHAYGRSEMPDMEGAREVTMSWASHVPNPKPPPNERDFLRINKMAAKCNVANAKDLAGFSRSNFIMKAPSGPVGMMPKLIPSDVHPGFSYGVKARPSTPMHAVVQGDFEAAEEGRVAATYRMREEAEDRREKKLKVTMTKTAKIHIDSAKALKLAQHAPDSDVGSWKMSKYKKVTSRLHLAPLGKSASSPAL